MNEVLVIFGSTDGAFGRGWRRRYRESNVGCFLLLFSVTDGGCVSAQRLRTLPAEERENVLSKLFLLYGGSPSKSSKEAVSRGSAEDDAVDEHTEGDEASRSWDWKRDSTEWQLKSLTAALGLSSTGSREELVATVQKQLCDLAEPAEQLSVSLEKLSRIVAGLDRTNPITLAKGDSVNGVKSSLDSLQHRAKLQAKRVLEVDPFQVMQNRDQGPCVLDLAYLYMDFVADAFDCMLPLLRAEAEAYLQPGTIITQQLNRCMFLIFKVIGTSTNEGNLYDPRRAGRFLIELGKLRRAWRVNCGSVKKMNMHLDEMIRKLDNSNEGSSAAEEEAFDPANIIQLTPYALTELHESYHGPPSHMPTANRDETSTDSPKSWSAVWQPVSGSASPLASSDRPTIVASVQEDHTREPSSSDNPNGGHMDHAVPFGDAIEGLQLPSTIRDRRRDHTSSNFAARAMRFEAPDRPGTATEATQASDQVVDLNELRGVNGQPAARGDGEDDQNRSFLDWVQGHADAFHQLRTENAQNEPPGTADPEARLHATRLASSTRVHARLAFTERGQAVRVPTQQPVSQSRMRDATSITRLVTTLSTRLRAVSTPLLDTGKNKTRSPNTVKLLEHIARWELLGYSRPDELQFIGLGKPGLITERLAELTAKDGRWSAVLGRALTVHCMPMQICIMNGLISEAAGEFDGVAPASMFCTAVTVVIRMIFKAYLEAGEAPKVRAVSWWKTIAHLSDVLVCWSCGSNGISTTYPNTGLPGQSETSDVTAKAILIGLSCEGGDEKYTWGKLFALVAPKLLYDLAEADVPGSVVDSVSGLCYLFARIIGDAAKSEPKWNDALELATLTIPVQLRSCLKSAAEWAKQAKITAELAGPACEKYLNKDSFTMNEEPKIDGFSFHDRSNSRKGIRLGILLGLAASFSYSARSRIKARSSVIIPHDDAEDRDEIAEAKGVAKRGTRSDVTIDLDPVVAALDDCVSALACIGAPLAMIGWALDGGHKGIRGGLSLLGNSRWLGDNQGEFPVYSPIQQIVDMTQLLLHTFAELRPAGTSASNAVNALLSDAKWHKTFSMLQAVSPNMFYFGSSLDLIGASADVFPHSFKISRLRKDLKRHAAEFQNATSISLVLDRTSPCPSAWRAINSLCRRALVGRSLNASFEGEDGLGDGVNREAMQILVDTLARGTDKRPEEAILCPFASDDTTSAAYLTLRPDAPHAAAVFFGKVLGLIISSNVTVNLPLAPWLWSFLLGRKGTLSQLSAVDEEFGRTLMTLHTHPLSHESNAWVEMSDMTFSRSVDLSNGQVAEIELIPGGRDVLVTDTNRKRFVQAYAWHSMEYVRGGSIAEVARAARKGLCDVIPAELLSSLSAVDLERLVCGLPKISVKAWREATIYEPKVSSPEEERRVEWFWNAVNGFTSADQALLLHFWAAYTHLPHSGFEGLHFKIRFDEKLSTDHLPMAQTCFLTLRIPRYVSAEQCTTRLLHAIRTGNTGFGFA
jgi:hypothetical protein